MCYLYILESETADIHYVGIKMDTDQRLKDHNSGRNKFTKGHIPWKILY